MEARFKRFDPYLYIPFIVPFDEKEKAKQMGAAWHGYKWCARTESIAKQMDARWLRAGTPEGDKLELEEDYKWADRQNAKMEGRF
eukprot:523849-Pleurochrysis_carterae.AAC.1